MMLKLGFQSLEMGENVEKIVKAHEDEGNTVNCQYLKEMNWESPLNIYFVAM